MVSSAAASLPVPLARQVVRLEAFEGPLDLLLSLVEAEDLDISAISLAHVLEPFVAAIRARAQDERYPLEDLAHFLVVAAKLVALKARALVPDLVEPDEDGPSLVERVRAYQAFVRAGEWFRGRLGGGAWLFARGPVAEPEVQVLPLAPPLDRFRLAFLGVLQRQERPAPPSRPALLARLVTLEERIAGLRALVQAGPPVSFAAWLGPAAPREVAVVSFLALLELLKGGTVTVKQSSLFSDLVISSV